MRPPLAGRRGALRRLAEQVRRRLEPVERVLPVKVPGFSQTGAAGASPAGVEPALESEPGPEPTLSAHDAAARIDAARERLRATIEPPDDPEG